jgi:hypothetical protein
LIFLSPPRERIEVRGTIPPPLAPPARGGGQQRAGEREARKDGKSRNRNDHNFQEELK